ncbi:MULTISPECIES: DUF3144 domain-containing protein [Ferrimonas]|uniref:DUF3144 domain-containing protein n=1 Tax=Ferrimonas sediminum TaxID=718193 RepID=A0A1G8Y2N7_9GAMM|nr:MULTISPECIES: DUF3144 domain-containing protein [Ferrimonas]USD36601.1 DUF3144 domain-containing protein [Ferrimonas sp. SCSIO 43195]SDJ97041.1 Protein of unknown function [Ferrimonas sediminum]
MSDSNNSFYDRANAHIHLANDHNKDPKVEAGEVSASFMWGVARYNAWFGAAGFKTKEEMAVRKVEMMEYYIEEYRKMLEANMDDYIENFDRYMKPQN